MKKKTIDKNMNHQIQRILNSKRHKKIRRRKKISFYSFLFVTIIGMGIFFVIHTFFKISQIEISGSEIYTNKQVLEVLNIHKGDNIFKSRSSKYREKLKNNLIYIDDVIVKKKLPNKIYIKIKDSLKKYFIDNGVEKIIISENMKILCKVKKEDGNHDIYNLIELKGIKIEGRAVGQVIEDKGNKIIYLKNIIQYLNIYKLKDIRCIDLTSSQNIKMNYQDRITLLLGTAVQLDYKIKFAKNILEKNIDRSEKGIIDLSSADSVSTVYFSPIKDDIINEPSTSEIDELKEEEFGESETSL